MSHLRVRPAEPTDSAWIATVLRERWGDTVVSRGRVHDVLALPAFVAELDDTSAGVLTYKLSGDTLEVVTVDALVQRRGVGRALMFAARQSCRRLWLITTNDNVIAQRFYERLGMRLAAVHSGAMSESRRLKPSIPLVGYGGVPIEDEWEYEWEDARAAHARATAAMGLRGPFQ